MGFVYFAETADGRFVKIGYTNNVNRRISELNVSRPGESHLRLIASIPGTFGTERQFHSLFSEDHDTGEWFRKSEKLTQLTALLGLAGSTEEPVSNKTTIRYVDGMRQQAGFARADVLSSEQRSVIASLGGMTRAINLTPEERRAAALKAIRARWEQLSPRSRINTSEAGAIGAAVRILNTTPEQRTEQARKAVGERWRRYYQAHPEKRRKAKKKAA